MKEYFDLSVSVSFCTNHQKFEWEIEAMYFEDGEPFVEILDTDLAETFSEAWAAVNHSMSDFYQLNWQSSMKYEEQIKSGRVSGTKRVR